MFSAALRFDVPSVLFFFFLPERWHKIRSYICAKLLWHKRHVMPFVFCRMKVLMPLSLSDCPWQPGWALSCFYIRLVFKLWSWRIILSPSCCVWFTSGALFWGDPPHRSQLWPNISLNMRPKDTVTCEQQVGIKPCPLTLRPCLTLWRAAMIRIGLPGLTALTPD